MRTIMHDSRLWADASAKVGSDALKLHEYSFLVCIEDQCLISSLNTVEDAEIMQLEEKIISMKTMHTAWPHQDTCAMEAPLTAC